MDRDIEEIFKIYKNYCDSLKRHNRFFIDDEIHNFFDKIIQNNTIEISKGNVLYRARINEPSNPTPYTGKDIGLPPSNVFSLGRANPYGINYLYLATDAPTALAEVRPQIKDYVTVGSFKVKRTIKVVELSRTVCGGGTIGEIPTAIETSNFASFLSNKFRKPISTLKELEYLPMQYFTEYCKTKRINGIKFLSSVMNNNINLYFNITLFDDSNVEFIESKVYQIDAIKYETTDI